MEPSTQAMVNVPPSVRQDVIVVDGLAKQFPNNKNKERPTAALGPVSFTQEDGTFVAVLGPSGCGKSTLMNLVAGLTTPTAGRVLIRGDEVHGPYDDLGVVFQKDLLMDWRKTLGNILVQADMRGVKKKEWEQRALDLLDLVGLADAANKYPHELSGGMRQRVAICRALVHDPSLLLMDEPFGALDALTRDQMNLELQRIWLETSKAVLFITHSIGEAIFLADRILVMSPSPGTLVDDITVDLPRPRSLASKEDAGFVALAKRIRAIFEQSGENSIH